MSIKFTPSYDRPITFAGKAKERIRELIFQFGHVKTIEGDGSICTECYAKVTKIQQVHSFREVCMSTEEAQKRSRFNFPEKYGLEECSMYFIISKNVNQLSALHLLSCNMHMV